MIPWLITRNSSRAWQPLSRVNVTGLRRLQVKIENIYLFKTLIKNMETSLKAGFAQIFSCCPKILSCPKFGGAAAPLAPAARTPMGGRGRELSLSRSREENFSCRDRSQEMYKKA